MENARPTPLWVLDLPELPTDHHFRRDHFGVPELDPAARSWIRRRRASPGAPARWGRRAGRARRCMSCSRSRGRPGEQRRPCSRVPTAARSSTSPVSSRSRAACRCESPRPGHAARLANERPAPTRSSRRPAPSSRAGPVRNRLGQVARPDRADRRRVRRPFEALDHRLGDDRLTELPVHALITSPAEGAELAPGPLDVGGVAWGGRGRRRSGRGARRRRRLGRRRVRSAGRTLCPHPLAGARRAHARRADDRRPRDGRCRPEPARDSAREPARRRERERPGRRPRRRDLVSGTAVVGALVDGAARRCARAATRRRFSRGEVRSADGPSTRRAAGVPSGPTCRPRSRSRTTKSRSSASTAGPALSTSSGLATSRGVVAYPRSYTRATAGARELMRAATSCDERLVATVLWKG
jgi:hypothetical protein